MYGQLTKKSRDFVYYTNGHVCTSAIDAGETLKYVIPETDLGGTLTIGDVTTSKSTFLERPSQQMQSPSPAIDGGDPTPQHHRPHLPL